MRTIELIGLPGSGKTKVRRELVKSSRDQSPRILDLESALCEAIRAHGQTVPSDEKMRTADVLELSQIKRKRLIGRAFHKTGLRFDRLASFAANYPELLEVIMRIERTRGKGDQWALVNQWLFNLFARYDYISEQLNSSVVLLLDEGFAGRAVTMFAYDRPAASRRSIAEYVRSIPKPDGVVYLSCRPETCLSRLEGRTQGPPQRMMEHDVSQRRKIMRQAKRCIGVTLRTLRRMRVPVHQISTNAPLEVSMASCRQILNHASPTAS
jgi:thymidylate kinase